MVSPYFGLTVEESPDEREPACDQRWRARRGPDARQLNAMVGVLSLAVFMSSLDLFIVNLAFPYIGREYAGTSLSNLSWVLNGYTIVFAAVLVPGRAVGGPDRPAADVRGGLVAFSLGSLLCGIAPGVAALIAARVIQAVGAGADGARLAVAAAGRGPARRPAPRRIGTWSALGALGGPRSAR